MTDLNPHQHLALWLDLQAAVTALGRVACWGYADARLDYWPGADLHPVPTLVLACRGTQDVSAGGGRRCHLKAGDALVLAPGVCHRHPQPRGVHTTLQLGFRGGCCDYWLFNRQQRLIGKVPLQPYRRMMDTLVETADGRQRLRLLQELLDTFLHEPRHQPERLSPALEAMLRYMELHAHQEISAADLVQASGLGTAQAYALFQAYHGAAPKQVLQQRRIDIARAQLRAGASLSEVAVNSGFGTLRKMQRAFRRYAGGPARGA